MPISNALGAVRYYTKDDPYFYTVDNRPLQDLAANTLILANTMDTMLNGTVDFNKISVFTVSAPVSSDHISFTTPHGEQFRVNDSTLTAVNYLQVSGSDTATANVIIAAKGINAAIDVVFETKGAGSLRFFTNGFTEEQFRIIRTAASVNYMQVTGGASGTGTSLTSQGSDTDIDLNIGSKGAGVINFSAVSAIQFRVGGPASAANYVQAGGATTGNSPFLQSTGANSNIGMIVSAKGTGSISFYNNSVGTQLVSITSAGLIGLVSGGGSSSGLQAQAATTAGIGLICTNAASDATVWDMVATSGGQLLHRVLSDSNSVVNAYMQIIRSTTAVTQISFLGGNASGEQFRISPTNNSVNFIQVSGGVLGGNVTIAGQGADSSVSIDVKPRGSGTISLYGSAAVQFTIGQVASAVNNLSVIGATGGSNPALFAQGSDTDIGITINPKGAGNVILNPNTGDIRWNKALVALGGGSAATLGTIGASGPATAGQNTWLRVLDSTGATAWIPVWK